MAYSTRKTTTAKKQGKPAASESAKSTPVKKKGPKTSPIKPRNLSGSPTKTSSPAKKSSPAATTSTGKPRSLAKVTPPKPRRRTSAKGKKKSSKKKAAAPAVAPAETKAPTPQKKSFDEIAAMNPVLTRVRNMVVAMAIGPDHLCLTMYMLLRGEGIDAYGHPFYLAVNNGDFATKGIVASIYRRVSHDDNTALVNRNNTYNCRAFIGISEQGTNTAAERLEKMKLIADFMNQPANNKYGSMFHVAEENDHTPPIRPKLDHLILDTQLVELIFTIYNDVDSSWYSRYPDTAQEFFTPPYPAVAVARLGYPAEYPDAAASDAEDGGGKPAAEVEILEVEVKKSAPARKKKKPVTTTANKKTVVKIKKEPILTQLVAETSESESESEAEDEDDCDDGSTGSVDFIDDDIDVEDSADDYEAMEQDEDEDDEEEEDDMEDDDEGEEE